MTIEEIIKKWKDKIEYIEKSGMSESDDPYFATQLLRELIQDLERI